MHFDVALQYLVMGNCEGVKMSELLCLLLWSLVEVHSQTEFPYVSFMGETLLNHSYVDLTLVGRADEHVIEDFSHDIVCHTDLDTCCSGREGDHRGDWYFPNGTRLPGHGHIFEARKAQLVGLNRDYNSNSPSPSGIYHCEIPSNDSDISVRETVFVGVYATGLGLGDITISTPIILTVDSDLDGPSPQFTLTCISTGGPATTVTVSPLVDLLPLSLGPGTLSLSLKELRVC